MKTLLQATADPDLVARLTRHAPPSALAPAPDLPSHLRAASGIRRWHQRVVVLQDDVNALALLDESLGTLTPLRLPPGRDGGYTFGDALGNKALKMDLEACLALPDQRLVAFGSGSTALRERLVVVAPDLAASLVDGHAFYATLRTRADFSGAELNLEGAALGADTLYLFQRGNGATVAERAAVNAIAEIDLTAFLAWLDDRAPVPPLRRVRQVDLGHAAGVPFGFTDAAALPDGRLVFLAGAEDSPDTFRDGAVLGTRVGLLDLAAERLTTAAILDEDGLPTRLKLEGIDWLGPRDDGQLAFVVVADMDDPATPSILATLILTPRR